MKNNLTETINFITRLVSMIKVRSKQIHR